MTDEYTGAQLRDAGVDAVISADHAVHRGHGQRIRAVLDDLISSKQVFDADTIRNALPTDVQNTLPPNLLPALIRGAVGRGEIRCCGYRTSSRSSRHGGVLRMWIATGVELGIAA